MCNALSPEKAVMWTLLFEGVLDADLRAEHFTHESYRRWFAVMEALHRAGAPVDEAQMVDHAAALGYAMDHRERRALQRMLRVPPPPRVQANRALLIQALTDRLVGKRVHIERLIN